MKNNNIANNSMSTKAREKINTNSDSLELKKNFDACLTKFKTIKFCVMKLATSHILQLTTKIFTNERSYMLCLQKRNI